MMMAIQRSMNTWSLLIYFIHDKLITAQIHFVDLSLIVILTDEIHPKENCIVICRGNMKSQILEPQFFHSLSLLNHTQSFLRDM